MPEAFHLTASVALPDNGEVPDRIVFMPEGEHTIHCGINGKPGKRTVKVGPEIATVLQASLEKRLSKNVRPHAAFDHKEGKASFIPKAFSYEAGRGVIVEVDWTRAGREAVEGRDYSYFSPSFLVSKSGDVLGLTEHGEIGSLVNDPAFEAIERIAASRKESEDMEQLEQFQAALVAAKIVSEEQSKDLPKLAESISAHFETIKASAIEAAVTEATKDAPEKSELEQEVERLKVENKSLSDQLSAKRAADADEAITAAVKEGRIPAQDAEAKAFWRESIINGDAVKVKAQLAKLPAADPLKAKRIQVNAKGEAITASREEFAAMTVVARGEFMKSGGTLTDN